jgi:hypothetical protein
MEPMDLIKQRELKEIEQLKLQLKRYNIFVEENKINQKKQEQAPLKHGIVRGSNEQSR